MQLRKQYVRLGKVGKTKKLVDPDHHKYRQKYDGKKKSYETGR